MKDQSHKFSTLKQFKFCSKYQLGIICKLSHVKKRNCHKILLLKLITIRVF